MFDNNLIKSDNYIISSNTFLKHDLNKNETLIFSFESKSDFLFLYDFSNDNNEIENSKINNFGIKYLNINNKNILSIGFIPFYTTFSEFLIIIAKKMK